MIIEGQFWPRDSYGYINMSVNTEPGGHAQDCYEERAPQEPGPSAWSAVRHWNTQYVEQQSSQIPAHRKFIQPGNPNGDHHFHTILY